MKQKERFNYLPKNALFYIDIDVKKSRPILDSALDKFNHSQKLTSRQLEQNNKYAKMFLDKTKTIVAGYYPKNKTQKVMGAAFGGGYPASLVNMALGSNKQWSKVTAKSKLNYWKHTKSNIAFSLQNSKAFFSLGGGEPFSIESSTEVPLTFTEFKKGQAVSLFFPDAALIKNILESMDVPVNLPITNFFVSLTAIESLQEEKIWTITFFFEATSPSQAKALAAIFKIAKTQLKNLSIKDKATVKMINLMFAGVPQQDGNNVFLYSPPLSLEDILSTISLTGLLKSNF